MARVEPYVHVEEVIKDTPTLLSIDGTANIGCTIVSDVGPQLAYISGPEMFLKNYTKDGVTVPRNAHISWINAYYMSFFAGMVIARSMNSTVTGGLKVYHNGTDAFSTYGTYYKDGEELTRKQTLSIVPAIIQEETVTDYAFVLNDIVYYVGDKDTAIGGIKDTDNNAVDLSAFESVDLAAEIDTDKELLPQVLDNLVLDINSRDVYTAVRSANTVYIYRDSVTEASVLNQVDVVNDQGELVSTDLIPFQVTTSISDAATVNPDSGLLHLFDVICKTPASSTNPNKIALSKQTTLSGHKVFTMTLTTGTADPEDYLVSLDPEAVDYSEINCYLEQLNNKSSLEYTFKVAEGGSAGSWSTPLAQTGFGAAFVNTTESAKTAYLKQAFSLLEEQELYQIAYIAPVGITASSYIKTYTAIGDRNKWFAPVDVPYDRTNVSSISAYGATVADSYNTYMVGPFDKNVSLTGWVNYIAATTLYYERVMNNRAARSEFAPVFDKSTGLLAYTNPTKLLRKSAREQLISLSCPINYAIYDQRSDSYYLNDNWTHYSKADNIMGEECNARMAHKISRDLNNLYQQFKAKYNSDATRREVINVTDSYFSNNIMNQNYKPEEYLVICDTSNNTDEVIRAHKLAITVKVRMYNSIKYIEVLNELYSVGGAAFTE